MKENTDKLPWTCPQLKELDIKMTENGGGYDGFDLFEEDTGS